MFLMTAHKLSVSYLRASGRGTTVKSKETKLTYGFTPRNAQALMECVVQHASGVFLWAHIVVDSLLEGLMNGDGLTDLWVRLNALPTDLEALFDKLLNRLDPLYFPQACQLFQLVEAHPNPYILELFFADHDDVKSAISAKAESLSFSEKMGNVEQMTRLLKSRCKGFLECYDYADSSSGREADENSRDFKRYERVKVRWFHRIARDFLHSAKVRAVIVKATSDSRSSPEACWANGFLWCLKTRCYLPEMPGYSADARRPFSWCIEYGLRLQKSDGNIRRLYFDEVGRLAVQAHLAVDGNLNVELPYSPKCPATFLELAIGLGLEHYVRTKIQSMSISEVKRCFRLAGKVSKYIYEGPTIWLLDRDHLRETLKVTGLPNVLIGYDGPQSPQARLNDNIDLGIEPSVSVYFSDSGYASAPPVSLQEGCQASSTSITFANTYDERADQTQHAGDADQLDSENCNPGTIYSDASIVLSEKERHIAELVEDLVENISEGGPPESVPLEKLYNTLPSLLKAFATTLGCIGGSQAARDIMVFISKYRQ